MKQYPLLVSLVLIFAGSSVSAYEPPSIDCFIVGRANAAQPSLAQKLLDEFKEIAAIRLCITMLDNKVHSAAGLFPTPDIGNFKVLKERYLTKARVQKALGRNLPNEYVFDLDGKEAQFQVCERKKFDCELLDTENYFLVRNMTHNELSQTLNEWENIKSRSNLEFEIHGQGYLWLIWRFKNIRQKLNIQLILNATSDTGEHYIYIKLVQPNSNIDWDICMTKEGNSFKLDELSMFYDP